MRTANDTLHVAPAAPWLYGGFPEPVIKLKDVRYTSFSAWEWFQALQVCGGTIAPINRHGSWSAKRIWVMIWPYRVLMSEDICTEKWSWIVKVLVWLTLTMPFSTGNLLSLVLIWQCFTQKAFELWARAKAILVWCCQWDLHFANGSPLKISSRRINVPRLRNCPHPCMV